MVGLGVHPKQSHYITIPNTALLRGNPSKWPYICIVWLPPKWVILHDSLQTITQITGLTFDRLCFDHQHLASSMMIATRQELYGLMEAKKNDLPMNFWLEKDLPFQQIQFLYSKPIKGWTFWFFKQKSTINQPVAFFHFSCSFVVSGGLPDESEHSKIVPFMAFRKPLGRF